MRAFLSIAVPGVAAVYFAAVPVTDAQAQSQTPTTGSLVTLVGSGLYDFNRLERLSAIANQAAYNQLFNACDGASAPTPACPQAAFRTFANVRELVHTANEILGTGPTQYSLRTDSEGLGFALRWTAAEELAAPGSANAEFANTQLASVMSRINALRLGASGFTVAALGQENEVLGGGAAAGASPTRWGGFLNYNHAYGERDPTELEDAFGFDGDDVVLGVDYRFTNALVLGAMAGYSTQTIDFDSTRSVTDGTIESEGYGLTLYGLYEWDGPYLSLALAWQQVEIDITRIITYPSFNPLTESTYATARGATESTTLTGSFNVGWAFNAGAFGIEPYLRAEYRDIGIDGFRETSAHNFGALAGQPAGLDFAVGDQAVTSLDGAFGLRLQYAFTPGFGVILPYAKAELHRSFDTDPFVVSAAYNGQSTSNVFNLPSEERDDSFQVFAAGASVVWRGGWQGFAQFQTTTGIDYLEHQVIALGLRGEF